MASNDATLIVLAPRLTGPYLDEVRQAGLTVVEEERGVHRIDGASFRVFMIETDLVAGTPNRS